ncbi:MAG: VWA domain-containing protein [Burkholderiaceae bacterium]
MPGPEQTPASKTNDPTESRSPALIGENVVHFGRFLRNAGLPVGPDRITNAMKVLALVGVKNRNDMHSALASVLVDRHENQPIFDGAFEMFWDRAGEFKPTVAQLAQDAQADQNQAEQVTHARLAQQFQAPVGPQDDEQEQADAAATFSERERLREQDFASMTQEEFRLASRLVRQLNLPLQTIQTRRSRNAVRGHIDLRRTAQRMVRTPDTLRPAYRQRIRQDPPIVVLLDISGSMERYARMFLHFTHGLVRRYQRVDALVFGTRLTNISRCLRDRDVDVALRSASRQVQDWHGGTRIGTSLKDFNHLWARRLLGGNATLILVTDGLDRDDGPTLAREAGLLRRFARQIIWLNPLLRYDGFEPKAAGIKTLLPLTDHFLPVHNVNSLADLGEQLKKRP